jgi:hypothetical protein
LKASVPLFTLTVPALLNGTSNSVVAAPLWFSVPLAWLLKASVPPLLIIVGVFSASLFSALKVPVLLKTLLPALARISLPSVHVTVPKLLTVRALKDLLVAPLIARVAAGAIAVVPPPPIVPSVQFNVSVTVTVAVPPSVPLRVPPVIEVATLKLAVPALAPVPLMLVLPVRV